MSDLGFTVRVYNQAQIHRGTIEAAKRQAARIYSAIGIETRWVDCPTSESQEDQFPECVKLENGPTVLTLQILPRRMARAFGFNGKTFGFALPSTGDGFAHRAHVFAHRVEELAYLRNPSKAVILGHVMAHELGHLFLGPGSHSSLGLMGFPWGKKRLGLAGEGGLVLTEEQGEEIREQVRMRMGSGRVSSSTWRRNAL